MPLRRLRLVVNGLLILALSLCFASRAHAIKVVTWNILNYPSASGATREDDFRVVITALHPDVIITQEMTGSTSSGQNQWLNNVLNSVFPGEYAVGPWVNGPDTDNSLFYRISTIDFISNQNIDTQGAGGVRDISEYVVRPDGYTSSDANLYLYSMHLKAGSTSSDQAKRLIETTVLRNHANNLPANTHFIYGGDFNIRSSNESSYGKLINSEADNDGRAFDPISTPGTWHNSVSLAWTHTQSPRNASQPDGGATGGMDDRFDFLLTSAALLDNEGLAYVTGTYDSYGNDGLHCCNDALTDPPTIPEGAAMATALHNASDHLPVIMEIQLPATISVAASVDFGTVIVGATADDLLNVANTVSSPGDELDYSFSPPAGFTAPGGSFQLNAGTNTNHTISMDTGTAGVKGGNMTVDSDDVDNPSSNVALSGTVVDHAVPSVQATPVVTTDTIDFGVNDIGGFSDMPAFTHNSDYSALQSQLDVYAAAVTGPDASRFSIVGGFSPSLVAGTAAQYDVSFDDSGGAAGSTYTAVLTFSTRDDQALPGAANKPDLVFNLTAEISNVSGVGDGGAPPVATLLLGNHPNPLVSRTTIAFELAEPGPVRLNIFDVRGRLVSRVVDRFMDVGRYSEVWDGRFDDGREAAAGVYFYRLETGAVAQTKSMTLMR